MTPSAEYIVVREILTRGNQPGLIAEWFTGLKAWADANPGQDAAALRTWLELAKPRPFYTAEELCRLWPPLLLSLGLKKCLVPQPTPNRLHNVLTFHGLPILKNANGTNYFRPLGVFFIVDRCHFWRDLALTDDELTSILKGEEFP